MEEEITPNLIFLTESLTNLTNVLVYLLGNAIISMHERQEIEAKTTSFEQNDKLLMTILKKDWPSIRKTFLEILRSTNNEHCADRIEGISSSGYKPTLQHPKVLKSKWWPDKKQLIESLLRRKHGSRLLIDELHDLILKDKNRMAVICESSAASKYSGMGGVGKTVTAKWYSHHYEDFYNHILWMDSGEGSLLQSFQTLALDLEIKNRNELLKIQDFSRKCYEELKKWRCLWIFDNTESYRGKDGIFDVLPKYQGNFYCLITSRSQDWGVKNVGMGAISDLQLDIFSEGESLEFLQSKLDPEIKQTDQQLKELCRLLGNLPLAMELALAALNGRKIDLKTYIKKISEKDLAFVDPTFDEYETKINKNIKISIDMILEEENGKLANEILNIFGYIRADDIPEEFIHTIFNSDDLENVIELLIKYSLISKESKNSEINFLSIHRLLQQVIRHNCRIHLLPSSAGTIISYQRETTENKILRKIFRTKGFTDLKLIPFVKYANKKLRNEFPKVKAELLDQEQLKKLVKEERFDEAVDLAKFIDKELKTKTTKFNYSVCLEKNGKLDESVVILEELEKEEMREDGNYGWADIQMRMLRLEVEVSKYLIYGQLLALYWKLDKGKRTKELLEKRKHFKIIHSNESLDILIRIIHSDPLQSNYSMVKDRRYATITFKWGTVSKDIELSECSLDLSSFDRLSPTELILQWVSFTRGGQKLEEVTANEFIDLDKINRLTLRNDFHNTNNIMCIDLSGEVCLEYLYLNHVRVLGWKESKWNIQRLELWDIPFVEKAKMMTIKEIIISNSFLDISCLPRTIQKLELDETNVICSGEIDFPSLNYLYLTLRDMSNCSILSFFHSVNISHIHFNMSKAVNVDPLPKSIRITRDIENKMVVGRVRKVDKLTLEDFPFPKVKELLSHLKTDDLVVYHYWGYTPKDLIELTEKEIKRIAVGKVKWWKEDFSILSSHVDRKADFYLWEGGRGRGIEEAEILELAKFS